MATSKFIAFLAILLLTVLAGMGIIELWQPELIDGGVFVKVGGTFGVLILLSFLVSFITGLVAQKDAEEEQGEPPKEPK